MGDNPKDNFSKIVELACDAAKRVTDFKKIVHCSFGDFTVQQYFWQINMFRGLRAHDIAKVIEVDSKIPEELVKGIWDEIYPNAEE